MRRVHHSLLLAALAGCAAPSRSSTPAQAAPAPALLKLLGQPAEVYGERPATTCPDSPLLVAVVRAVGEAARARQRPVPLIDGRLCQVAETLAQVMLDGAPPPQSAVELTLSHAGVIEPAPHFLVLSGDPHDVQGLVAELSRRLPDLPLHSAAPRLGLGIAPRQADGSAIIGVILQDSFVLAEPLPRALAHGGQKSWRGHIATPYVEPIVLITDVDGVVSRLYKGTTREFSTNISCGKKDGRYQIEIMATGPEGPSVLANFPLWCGSQPPTQLAVQHRAAVHDAGAAEEAILGLVNAERERLGLRPLAWNDDAAQVARAHSQDMLSRDTIAHVSPTTGDVTDRVHKAGIRSPLVLENLARAYSPEDVHQGLMDSPGHRQNILNADVTDLGIGVALDGRGATPALYVTQVFLRLLQPLDLDRSHDELIALIGARRQKLGKHNVPRDAGLDHVAHELAAELARGQGELSPQKRDALLSQATAHFRAVSAVVGIMAQPSDLASDGLLAPADALGVGVAQGEHPTFGDNAVYVVVLMAQRG